MINKAPTITIVFNGVDRCSGACSFCTLANNAHYKQGVNRHDLLKSLDKIENHLLQTIQIDFNKLEEAIINYPGWKDSKRFGISVWGGEPLACFELYVELYEFIEDLAKRYNKEVSFSGSTNGLAFYRQEVTDWFLSKNNIHMQLSHDGWGQWMRSLDIDTLSTDNMRKLMLHGTINWISCVMNFYNASPKQNIKFFEEAIPEGCYDKIQTRLYTVRDSDYDSNFINYNGFLDNKVYDELKGKRLGDLVIRNDIALAKETGIFQLAHQADTYFSEIEDIYRHIDNKKYDPYRRVLIQRLAEFNKPHTEGKADYQRPLCARYHLGQSSYSNCIDTLGKYTECHLYDSTQHVPNPKMVKPEHCKQCKYVNSWECNVCGAMVLNNGMFECQWNYRHNELMERLSESRWCMDWVKLYNENKNKLWRTEDVKVHQRH